MIVWPQSLVAEIAERRCIIVLGAGASASCINADGRHPVDWKGLLTMLIGAIPDAGDRREAQRLANRGAYLDAAQIIVDKAPRPDFSRIILQEFQEPRYIPSRLHELVLKLDPKIVITTNYDDIYERYSTSDDAAEAYNVCNYYEDHAINDIRSTRRLILKVHGSVTAATHVVLSRSQYFNARRENQGFYSILDALFLTNTLLLIGCGLSDPDIQLLFENANIAAPSDHPHYAVVEKGRHASIKAAIKATHNLDLLEYRRGHHEEVVTALQDLEAQVQEYRRIRGA